MLIGWNSGRVCLEFPHPCTHNANPAQGKARSVPLLRVGGSAVLAPLQRTRSFASPPLGRFALSLVFGQHYPITRLTLGQEVESSESHFNRTRFEKSVNSSHKVVILVR